MTKKKDLRCCISAVKSQLPGQLENTTPRPPQVIIIVGFGTKFNFFLRKLMRSKEDRYHMPIQLGMAIRPAMN